MDLFSFLNDLWSFLSSSDGLTLISCVSAVLTLFVAGATWGVAISSKKAALTSNAIADKAYHQIEREEPWKLTPLPKEGYWILERIHPIFATIYGYILWENNEWENNSEGEITGRLLKFQKIDFFDFHENEKRYFSRGTKVVVRIPSVPVGSSLGLYYREWDTEKEAKEKAEYKGLLVESQQIRENKISDKKSWYTPLY